MKRLSILATLILIISHSVYTQNKQEKLGLIGELTYLKLTAENQGLIKLNDSILTSYDKSRFINLYNNMKVLSDQFLLQYISELNKRNSLRLYKKMDNLLFTKRLSEVTNADLNNKKLEQFKSALVKVQAAHNELINFKKTPDSDQPVLSTQSFWPAAITLAEITGALTFVTSTLKSIKEGNQKKVEKIASMLEASRLKSPQELINPKKMDDKPKE